MSFGKRGDYFDSFMSPRLVTGLKDFLEIGLIPKLDRVYRSDLMEMMGKRETDTDIDAVLLTHAHAGIVWCDYTEFEDIPNVKQIFGHTRGNIRQTDNHICIDTELDYYAVYDSDLKIIKNTLEVYLN